MHCSSGGGTGSGGEWAGCAPVGFVQDHDLVAPRRQRHLLLGEHLYLVPHNVDASASPAPHLAPNVNARRLLRPNADKHELFLFMLAAHLTCPMWGGAGQRPVG